MSVEFYNQNAQQFFSSTVEVDSTSLLDQFVPYLPQGGLVLDAGCGSGRDSKRFLDMGYQIDAFDASAPLAALAEELLNQSVTVTTSRTLPLVNAMTEFGLVLPYCMSRENRYRRRLLT